VDPVVRVWKVYKLVFKPFQCRIEVFLCENDWISVMGPEDLANKETEIVSRRYDHIQSHLRMVVNALRRGFPDLVFESDNGNYSLNVNENERISAAIKTDGSDISEICVVRMGTELTDNDISEVLSKVYRKDDVDRAYRGNLKISTWRIPYQQRRNVE
jgi:hypothetical protein